jgi:hypothetical protein
MQSGNPRDDLRKRVIARYAHLLPDVGSPEFAAEARRQSLLIAQSPQAKEDQAFIDAISCWNELEC